MFQATYVTSLHSIKHPLTSRCNRQVRSLNYPVVYKSLKNFVIDAMGAEMVKTFMYLKLEDAVKGPFEVAAIQGVRSFLLRSPRSTTTHEGAVLQGTYSESSLSDALSYIQPSAVSIPSKSPPPISKNPKCSFGEASWMNGENAFERSSSQWQSAAACYKLVTTYEKENSASTSASVVPRSGKHNVRSIMHS